MNAFSKTQEHNIDGQVSPRVLKGILDEGSYAEDPLFIEYFGGVLASSKSGSNRDDRGVVLNSLLSRLTTYQLRTHYIVYHMIYRLSKGANLNLGDRSERKKISIYIPSYVYLEAMDFTEDERKIAVPLINHSFFGLSKENLIGDNFLMGNTEF